VVEIGRRLTHEFVSGVFKENGCLLLDEYENARTPMRYRCTCGNEDRIRYDDFRTGKRCKVCKHRKIGDSKRLSYDYVRDYLKEYDYELLSESYLGRGEKIKYRCPEGHVNSIEFHSFKAGHRCRDCAIDKRREMYKHDIEYIRKVFRDNGCELLSKEYVNFDEKLKFRCSCGGEGETTFGAFRKGVRCGCGYKSGPENPKWNPNITDEERIQRRQYPEYREWRTAVYERDSYTCQKCKRSGGRLNAHHIVGYAQNRELRTDLSNGITLCKGCHKKFHSRFGIKDNTK
jgi:hypothetical protein